MCSLLCPLFSASLCSSSTETSERYTKIDVPSPEIVKYVCVEGLSVDICVCSSVQITCWDSIYINILYTYI